MSIVKEKLGLIAGGKILDVGSGRGWFIELLKENLKSYSEIIGIDIRDDMLQKAEDKFNDERIKFMHMDATDIAFEDKSIDTVSISNTLHHLPDPKPILKEMKRVLKDGGQFIVQEMYCDNQSRKQQAHVALHHFEGDLDVLRGICHRRTYKREEIIDIVHSMDLEMIQIFDHNTHEEQKQMDNLDAEKEAIEEMCNKLKDDKLASIKHLPEYRDYRQRLENLKEELLHTGFFTASELIIVARKRRA